jgi:hypothetical protein
MILEGTIDLMKKHLSSEWFFCEVNGTQTQCVYDLLLKNLHPTKDHEGHFPDELVQGAS